MIDLIEALNIFLKYDEPKYPCHCEHDILYIYGDWCIEDFSDTDIKRLEELSFTWDKELEGFYSYTYGSC